MSKRKILVIVFGIIFLAVFLFTKFLKQIYVVPILMYHSVRLAASPKDRLSVSSRAFERQMRFLKEHRYNVVPLESLITLAKNKGIPPRTVCITFDDGYKNNYTHAFPILKKYNLPATMFIITGEIGRPRGDRLSWDKIKVMQDSGIIIFGSHGLGPEPLINIKSKDDLKKEIFDSKKILEKRLGREVILFSYPEGRFNAEIRQLVIDAGYQAAVTTSPGKEFSNNDIFALKRLRISSTSDNLFVFWIEASGLYTFIKEHRDSK